MNTMPLYCTRCGRKLLPRQYHTGYYNATNGEEKVYTELACELKFEPWAWFRASGHSVFRNQPGLFSGDDVSWQRVGDY